MRQDDSVKAFKNLLNNYLWFKNRVEYYQEQIDDCYDKLGASPKSIDYSRVITHSIPNKDFEYKMREYIEFYTKKQKYFVDQCVYINSILDVMPEEERQMATDMYVFSETEKVVAERYYLSPTGMRYRINKAIKKALDD